MSTTNRKAFWIGWVISIISSALFVFSAVLKLMGGPEVEKGFAHVGIPASMMVSLAFLELACVVVYLIPQTAVIGAILLTGYIGGTIVTHWRSGDPFYVQIVLGILVWLGLYLREDRLKPLIPLRTRPI